MFYYLKVIPWCVVYVWLWLRLYGLVLIYQNRCLSTLWSFLTITALLHLTAIIIIYVHNNNKKLSLTFIPVKLHVHLNNIKIRINVIFILFTYLHIYFTM